MAVLLLFVTGSYGVWAQHAGTLDTKKLKLSATTGASDTSMKAPEFEAPEKINVPVYLRLLGTDLKQAFGTPVRMKGDDWANTGKFLLVAAGLSFLDEPVQQKASHLLYHHPVMQNISREATNFGGSYEICVLAGLGAYGLLFKNQKIKNTMLLATQAYITSAAVGKLVKFLTNRQRPFVADSSFAEVEPTFHGPFYKTSVAGSPRGTNSSFPSAHTTVAFAAATVFAMEYRDKPLVPILAYSAATLVGLSRLTENKHWATDVLTGAALGYLSGRLVVRNFHRLVQKTSQPGKATALHFNLGYDQGKVVAGLFYTFR